MRGEHVYIPFPPYDKAGSSPHARGAPLDVYAALVGGGIIPACAGSTSEGLRIPGSRRDHPRMRGEH